jgi:hypothetical protein
VLFEGDVFAALRDAATFLADQEPRLGVEIEGVVVALDTAVPAGHDRREGNLTIGAIVDGNVRRIRVGLPEPIYSRAVEAHRDERRVAVTGNLIREGRHYRLVEPRSFVLLD